MSPLISSSSLKINQNNYPFRDIHYNKHRNFAPRWLLSCFSFILEEIFSNDYNKSWKKISTKSIYPSMKH